jgi:DNA-binding transcriptional regulator YdaS (Cro superfamily)
VELAGNSQTGLAKAIGLTPQAVQRWVSLGRTSAQGAVLIEKAYPGRITRAELCPIFA